MKRFLPLAILFVCISCLTEEGADPGKSKTFFRYFNGGYDDYAQAFDETPDGNFIILATTQLTPGETKIKLIKADRYGNRIWQEFPSFPGVSAYSNSGKGILIETDGADAVTGYTIVGDSIGAGTGLSYLYVLQTDDLGNYQKGKGFITDSDGGSLANLQGAAIRKVSDGYLVLGAKTDDSTEDMILIKLRNDLSIEWFQHYGSGETTNINSLYTTGNDDEIYWGGTVKRIGNQTTDIRFIKTVPDNAGTIADPTIGLAESNEEIGGICYSTFGPSFNVVGTTDELGTRDVVYKRISTEGSESISKIIEDDAKDEAGNAICTTRDQGTIIIATAGLGELSDYYLIKLNYFGEVMWSKKFGSEKEDQGVGVKQINDGSYVVLGTTVFGGRHTIMFSKRNSTGNIE